MTSTSISGEPSYPKPILTLSGSIMRPWGTQDAESLIRVANNPKVARNLRNRFPSPYTLKDAEWWINNAIAAPPPCPSLAIAHPTTNAIIGGISLELGSDVECRTAEVGYWLGEEYWGQGIMSEAAKAFVDWGFREMKVKDKDGVELGLMRIFATAYAYNKGSEAVLKKAGLVFEGVSRASAWKHGQVVDQLIYAMTREDWENQKTKESS
jgi:ribosomal-protein-alanine N-acetyltransferase